MSLFKNKSCIEFNVFFSVLTQSVLKSSASKFTIDDELNFWLANKDKLEKYNDEGKNKQILYVSVGADGIASIIYEIEYYNGLVYFSKYNKGLLSFYPLNSKVTEYSSRLLKKTITEDLIKQRLTRHQFYNNKVTAQKERF